MIAAGHRRLSAVTDVVIHALTLHSSLRLLALCVCDADLLYVQVVGESGAGDVRLQQGDSLADAVDRAVEKKRIPSIFWVDVAGWELWGSREKVGRPIQSGTSSEPLSDLPAFPSKSLLVLTRRPIPPTTSSSSPLDDSNSGADSFLGPKGAAVLVFRPGPPTRARGLNGILVSMHNSNAVQQFFVFSVAHGVVQRFPEAKIEIEHRNIRLLLLQPGADTLSVEAPETLIELVWSRCIHTARAFWTVEKDVERFKADCSIFEPFGNQLSDAVKARAVSMFQWQGTHKPSSKAVGVSLVRDKADGNDQTYIEVRIEERMSGCVSGESPVCGPTCHRLHDVRPES